MNNMIHIVEIEIAYKDRFGLELFATFSHAFTDDMELADWKGEGYYCTRGDVWINEKLCLDKNDLLKEALGNIYNERDEFVEIHCIRDFFVETD